MRRVLGPALLLLLLLLVPAQSWAGQTVAIRAEWDQYDPPAGRQVAGFRLYRDYQFVCAAEHPLATSVECQIEMPAGTVRFTLTAYFTDGVESPHSSPFRVGPPPEPTLVPIINLLLLSDE